MSSEAQTLESARSGAHAAHAQSPARATAAKQVSGAAKTFILMKRELRGYFATPVAYVFIVIYLLLSGWFTFSFGHFFENEQADLQAFFFWQPLLYVFLIPAISMRLWAEERKTGTVELLFTLPVSIGQTVLAKYLAAWLFTGLALLLTFPMWITVNYLGNPDNGVIVATYLGCWLTAGAYLAIGTCVSSMTKNQVIAFIVSLVVCLVLFFAGYPMVLEYMQSWAPEWLLDAVRSLSFFTHFTSIMKGVIDARDIVFFGSLIAACLFANAVILDKTKAD